MFSANFPLYGDLSNRVMSILTDYSPEIEIYSIDEAFLKLTGFDFFNLREHGESMRQRVLKWTGIPTLDLEEIQPKQSIATTRTFETNYTRFDELAERITTFTASCAEKLRQQKSCCNSLMVFVLTNFHRNDLPQYHRSIVIQLPFATNSTIELVGFANQALKSIYKEGYAYKKAGVIVQDITPEANRQAKLFDDRDKRHVPLMEAVDKLNALYGQQKIRLASQDQKRVWKMRQERLSPRYSTELGEVIEVDLRG